MRKRRIDPTAALVCTKPRSKRPGTRRRIVTVRRIPISTARERIADVIGEVAHRHQRVVLTRHGKEVGAIVPLADLEWLRAAERDPAADTTPTLLAYQESWRRVTDRLGRRR